MSIVIWTILTGLGVLLIAGGVLSLIKKYNKFFTIGFFSLFLMELLFVSFFLNKKEEDVITVALSPDYFPYAYMEKDKIKGLDVDLLEEIVVNSMKKKLVLKPVSWNFLMSSKGDIKAGGLSVTDHREYVLNKRNSHLSFSTSYAPAVTGFVIKMSGSKEKKALSVNFQGKIGVQAGTVFEEIVKTKFPKATIVLRDDFNIAVEEFKNGMIDGIVGDALVLISVFQNARDYKIYRLNHKITENSPKYTAFILDKSKINLDEFNLLLISAQQKNKGLYKKLVKELLALESF